jgi:prolyl-tRNA synthetase
MGSYGIGLSRIPAAIIESSNDSKGIIWPKEISPFQIMILNLKTNSELCNNFCDSLYKKLIMIDKDTLYDDRDERVGIKFSDADLIGIPVQIIIGKSFEEEETIQLKFRKNGIIKDFKADYFINNIIKILEND